MFSYTIGSRKLSGNEQFFLFVFFVFVFCCWCSNSSKVVTNNSDYIRRLFYVAMLLTPAQITPKSLESRRTPFFFFFYPGCMRLIFACVLGCWVASTVLSVPKPFGGRLPRRWTAGRRQSVTHTPSIAFRHFPPNSTRFGYATEGQRPPKGSGTNMTVEAT